MTPIYGERVMLRSFRHDDTEAMWQAVQVKEFMRLTGTHANFTREQTDAYIARQVAGEDDSRVGFIIALPDDSRVLGEVVIMNIHPHNRAAAIRISLFVEEDAGKGYGTEAMRLAVGHGFEVLGLHRIELEVYAFNPRARRVYEKVGFVKEGILRDALYWEGEWVDAILMSILEHDWAI